VDVCGSVCVGGGSGAKGGGWLGACYRGCYGHSKPGFEIKFEITIFEIQDYRFRDWQHHLYEASTSQNVLGYKYSV